MDFTAYALTGSAYLTALLAGLLGGVHCVGMCGGIAGALTFGLPESARGRWSALLPWLLTYNAGRILSYMLAGALVGWLGLLAGGFLAEYRAWFWLRLLAGLVMVALGLYLGGWWFGLARLEHAGSRVWRRVQPLTRRVLPVRHAGHALALGVLWGWLPCGLVYSALVYSLAAGGPAEGAAFMGLFGLGTLPTLLALGAAASRLAGLARRPGVRRAAGGMVIAFGLWTLAATLARGTSIGLGCLPGTP